VGVGYDNVDIEVAKKYRIVVTNTPNVNAISVPEIINGLILLLSRSFHTMNNYMQRGNWKNIRE